MTSNQARLAILATALIWSSGGLAVKITDCPAGALTGWRCLFCLLLFIIYYRKEKLLSFSWPQWGGAIAYFLMAYLYIAATQATTAANAILLQYTAPVYVALFSVWILKEKVSKKDWAVVGAVLCGMLLFFVDKASPGGMAGNLMAVGSGVSYALFIVFTRMQKNENPAGSVFLGNIIALAACFPAMLSAPVTPDAVAGGMYLGLIYGGVSYILYGAAIKKVSALTAILIASIEPILNPVWVFFMVGEKPSLFAVIGGAVVVGAVLVGNLLDLKKTKKA